MHAHAKIAASALLTAEETSTPREWSWCCHLAGLIIGLVQAAVSRFWSCWRRFSSSYSRCRACSMKTLSSYRAPPSVTGTGRKMLFLIARLTVHCRLLSVLLTCLIVETRPLLRIVMQSSLLLSQKASANLKHGIAPE